MPSRKIYVICPDNMCFYVDAETLDPLSCEIYDPHWSTTQPQMSHSEWSLKHISKLMTKYDRTTDCHINF